MPLLSGVCAIMPLINACGCRFFQLYDAAVPDRFIPVRVEELNIGYIDGMLCAPGRQDGVDV